MYNLSSKKAAGSVWMKLINELNIGEAKRKYLEQMLSIPLDAPWINLPRQDM